MRRLVTVSGVLVVVTMLASCGSSPVSSPTTSAQRSVATTRPSSPFGVADQNAETLFGVTVSDLATASQSRTASSLALLTHACMLDRQAIDHLKTTSLPAGASSAAIAQLTNALTYLDTAVSECLNDTHTESLAIVLPQILQGLSRGWPLLHQAAVTAENQK